MLDLPEGFQYVAFSRTGAAMDDGLFVPRAHDGMAAFAGADGKVILVRNHEVDAGEGPGGAFGEGLEKLGAFGASRLFDAGHSEEPSLGGTTTLVFDPATQSVERQFLSLAGTIRNCAGGPTPWGSWVSCEETVELGEGGRERDHGYNFEVPARADGAVAEAVPLRAMGRFNHEAIAVDPASGCVYQTEDKPDSLVYRFVPAEPANLAAGGRLQALVIRDLASADTRNWDEEVIAEGDPVAVRWVDIENVESPDDDLRMQGYDKGAARFARGEGIWQSKSGIYIACTNGGAAQAGQIFRYLPSAMESQAEEEGSPATLELFSEPNDPRRLEAADNLTVAPWGDVVIAEDGGGVDYLRGITPEGELYTLAKNVLNDGEFAGPCFSPDGSTLFVNIQSPGVTLAITGPWQA